MSQFQALIRRKEAGAIKLPGRLMLPPTTSSGSPRSPAGEHRWVGTTSNNTRVAAVRSLLGLLLLRYPRRCRRSVTFLGMQQYFGCGNTSTATPCVEE